MSERETAGAGDGERGATGTHDPGREYGTVALVAVCIVALVLALALLPALSALAPGGAPAEWLVPVPPGAAESTGGDVGGDVGGDASRFGALSPGDTQAVGGTVRENGTFSSLDTVVHFTVRSETPAYWRTGAYDTYTGDGWERSGPGDASAPTTGESVRYEVTLNRSAAAPPTVWQPVSLDGPDGLRVTDAGVGETDTALPAGTTYAGVSEAPPREPSVLRASGESYPAAIEERYTALPTETAAAVGPLAANVTANASDPYEAATSVERWLETNKEYSLAVEAPEDDVAEQFIYEMDAGYCEYFATSMVAMLRSQGVPARYVVGYSTGDRAGPDTYRVRAMNAHAWVEVYFADVGWVRFDPTPAADRIGRQRQRLQNEGQPGYDPPAAGSPDESDEETSTPAPTTPTPTTPTSNGSTTPVTTPGTPVTPTPTTQTGRMDYGLSLNRTAAPGATVAVSVTAGGLAVQDAAVRFDGDRVGETDEAGRVVAMVPYAETLTVTAAGGTAPTADTRLQAENATRTFDLETNGTLAISGDRRTGETVTVTGAVADVPVQSADVFLDGDRVARTDDSGRATVTLPSTPGNATLRVERGPVVATDSVALDALNASVDPVYPLPVAGTPIEVRAFVGGEPAAGIPVRLGGEPAGTTDLNGTVTAALGPSQSVPVVVRHGDQTVRTTVSNPLVNLLGLVGAALAVVAGTVAWTRRRGLGVRDLPRAVPAALFRGLRGLVSLFVGFTVAIGRALSLVAGRARLTALSLRALATGEVSAGELATAVRAWASAVPGRAIGVVAGVIPARLVGTADTERRPDAAAEGPHVTVRDGWKRFVDRVSVPDPESRTPGQLAAHAIAVDDLPADAVTTLRDEFRAVEYGPREPETAVPSVASAVETIDDAVAAREEKAGEADQQAAGEQEASEQAAGEQGTSEQGTGDESVDPGGSD